MVLMKKHLMPLERHDITPHIVNFRHRYFWDGGLHCITSDISKRRRAKKFTEIQCIELFLWQYQGIDSEYEKYNE